MERKTGGFVFLQNVYHAILFGISKVIPLIVTGGLMIAFSNLIGVQLLHYNFTEVDSSGSFVWWVLYILTITGKLMLTMILPFLSAYTAADITGNNDSYVAGLVGGLLARGGEVGLITIMASGYIGALISGISAGYLVKVLEKKLHSAKLFHSYDNVFIVPFFSTVFITVFMYYAVNPAIGGLNNWFLDVLVWMQSNNLSLLAGALTGAFANFDFGGPVNKIAYMFSTNLWTQGETVFYSAFTAAKIIPAFTIALSSFIIPGSYSAYEKKQVLPALLMTVFGGIGEGVIPYALKDPFSVIVSTMTGGAVSAAIVLQEKIGISVGAGGSLMTVALTSDPIRWLFAFLAGVAVSTAMLIFLKMKKNPKSGKAPYGTK